MKHFNLKKIRNIIAVFIVATVLLISFTSCAQTEDVPYEERIKTYEVVSVYKYVRNTTNNFGGIMRTEICYSFSYLDGDALKHIDDFEQGGYGNSVTIGDRDVYIFDPKTGFGTLQLTKETLKSLTGSGQ